MKNRTIIEHSQFRQMLSYRVCYRNRTEQRELKNALMGDTIEAYADKWIRLAAGTRQAIDTLGFMATERGFVYASKEWLAKAGVSVRTIDRVTQFLAEKGLLYVAYRRRGTFNLTGKPVFLFRNHPYFAYWADFLSLDVAANDDAGVAIENSQIPSLASGADDNRASTYALPDNHSNDSINNRSGHDLSLVPDYIDHGFAHLYSCYFDTDIKQINELWQIVKRQAWRINIDADHIANGAIHALKQTVGAMKIKPIKNMAAYFTATVKGVFERIFHEELAAILDNGDNVATNEGVPLG